MAKFQYTRVYVDPVDLKELDQKMKRLFKVSKKELSTEVGIWGTTTTRLAKERVPRDTGDICRAPAGALQISPESYAEQFRGKKEVNLPARPYLYNSARQALHEMLSNMNRKIKNIVK